MSRVEVRACVDEQPQSVPLDPTADAELDHWAAPAPPPPPPPERRQRSAAARVVLALTTALAVFVTGVVVWGFVHHPGYDELLPGDAEAVGPLISVHGAPTYKSPGAVLLVFVRERSDLNEWQYLWAKAFHGDGEIQPRPHISSQASAQQDVCDMTDSQATAKLVALRKLGYKVTTKPGILVESILDARIPAAKVLRCNDVIRSVDGQAVDTPDALRAAISRHKAGDVVLVGIDRGKQRLTRAVKLISDQGQTLIGVSASQRFVYPFGLTIDTADIGGPSAGLAMTLALLDDLTKGNLTGGKRVAVTGTIEPDASVGEIGGIRLKAIAASRRHVQVFIVPACTDRDAPDLAACKRNLTDAIKAAKGVKVVPVRTLDEALRALVENGGDPLPTKTAGANTP